MKLTKHCIFTVVFALLVSGCAPSDGTKSIKRVDQQVSFYTNKTNSDELVISKSSQQELKQLYLKKYYSPWDKLLKQNEYINLKNTQINTINYFKNEPGFREHNLPIKNDWVKKIEEKMDINHFKNSESKAITLRNTNVRVLPTNKASYKAKNIPGEGYPFDHLQETLIPANTPIKIVHQSNDKTWSLIICHFAKGWIKTRHLALVDENFIREYKTDNYITPSVLGICVVNPKNNRFLFQARLGTIIPMESENEKTYTIRVACVDKQETYASMAKVKLNKSETKRWPVLPSEKNLTQTMQTLVGQPYGWGGLFGYRDCSSTIMDIFATFGIWVPRYAKEQYQAGTYYSFENLQRKERINLIHEKGKPLITLINLSDHILLYIGDIDQKPYVLHDVWGMHTGNPFRDTGRSIIAKTVITPITLGRKYINVPKSFLDRAVGMTVIEG